MANPQYQFWGNPLAQAASVRAHENDSRVAAANAQGQGYAQAASNQSVPAAQANILGTLFSQPASFANSLAQAYGGMSQGMGGLGAGLGNAFSGYAGGMGNVAQAMSNERSNFYGSNAMAEAARQGAAGNLGAAALGAYGGASNAALGAWSANQTAYNKAMADMAMQNQQALSNYGVGRNAALSQLGESYTNAGRGFAGANAIAGLMPGSSSGGGFSATGPGGQIASGSYDAPDAQVGGGTGPGGYADQTFGGLGQLQNNIMSGDITGSLNRNYGVGMGALNDQHMSSRGQPSQMLGQTLQGLMTLGRQGYGSMDRGMDQFYATQNDPRNRADYSPILGGLASGFSDVSGRFGSMAGQLGSGYRSAASQMGGMLNNLRNDADPVVRTMMNMGPSAGMLSDQYAAQDMQLARADDLRRRGIRVARPARMRV